MILASMMSTPAGTTRAAISVGELAGDLVGVVTQRQRVAAGVVVGVAVGHVPQGGLALGVDEGDEVLDAVGGLGAVAHLPHDDGGDLDRVAVGVVDLHGRRLLVADPDRDLAAHRERVHPAQAGGADRAPVAAEELDDPDLAGLDGGEPGQTKRRQRQQANPRPYGRGAADR